MRSFNTRFFLSILIVLITCTHLAAGGRQEQGAPVVEDDVDYVGIAALMIRDGNYTRAADAIAQVNPDDPDIDLARYHTITGLLALRTNDAGTAITEFSAAIADGQDDPAIYVYLAQAYFVAEEYREVLDSVEQVPNLTRYPGLYGLRAAAHWNLNEWSEALAVLERAAIIFPDQVDFTRQRISYLLDLNLTQAASELSISYLRDGPQEADTYIVIGEALRRGNQTDTAIQVLEMARLRFPESEPVRLLLANAYLANGLTRTAAHLIEEAAASNSALYYEAAELYRRSGDVDKALYLNSLVTDASRKTRQRFNLLLMSSRYEEAVALEPRLLRDGATEDDTVRYSLAYGYFQNGQLDRAVEYLQGIASPEVFRQAVELRQIIERSRS